MAPTHVVEIQADRAGTVRARLLTALHVGRLRPGDRVPSVRRLADLAGVNHKTVHRAYTELAREGILEVRPGSGTFVADRRSGADKLPAAADLASALAQVRTDAERLGLEPAALAGFLLRCLSADWRDVTVGVVECNLEQIAAIGADLDRDLGVRVKPIPLGRLADDPRRAVEGVSSVVTTDCHWSEVVSLLGPAGIPAHAVALDPLFPRRLLDLALRDDVVLVVHDSRFGPVFARLLRQLTDEPVLLSRIRAVDARSAPRLLRDAPAGTWVWLSPLVRANAPALPQRLRRLPSDWHVAPGTLESVRVGLAMDRMLRQTA